MTDQLTHETEVRPVAPPQLAARDPLLVPNLLSDLDGLMEMLVDEIARESWLNSFLLAAGANQVLLAAQKERVRVKSAHDAVGWARGICKDGPHCLLSAQVRCGQPA